MKKCFCICFVIWSVSALAAVIWPAPTSPESRAKVYLGNSPDWGKAEVPVTNTLAIGRHLVVSNANEVVVGFTDGSVLRVPFPPGKVMDLPHNFLSASWPTVSWATNVVESDFLPNDIRNYFIQSNFYPPPPRTEKWVTTTVSRSRSVSFVWDGVTNVVCHVSAISTNTVHLKLKQDWEVVTTTNN